ncbi:hypothetical protein DAPPUDRAFT_103798 [Daphnia pulex]|uniref:Uncharacterized protein n=1 Tax=Daphnia pulex TaxID=6669 RepID=E9GKB1_DAPPU|nr:hypothetical protein DAPPUDRAFT_103798 [Daphnia pulex]|eukprot:EFX79954.1 hypothetical protein DAPPUDRAFT_103798 [Daphnia pulex]
MALRGDFHFYLKTPTNHGRQKRLIIDLFVCCLECLHVLNLTLFCVCMKSGKPLRGKSLSPPPFVVFFERADRRERAGRGNRAGRSGRARCVNKAGSGEGAGFVEKAGRDEGAGQCEKAGHGEDLPPSNNLLKSACEIRDYPEWGRRFQNILNALDAQHLHRRENTMERL